MSDVASAGFRVHSGWTCVVVTTNSTILDRRRIETAEAAFKQPFHAAEGLCFDVAEALIQRCRERSIAMATSAVRVLVSEFGVACAGLLIGSGRPLPDLAAILRSHAFIHSAEGEFYRDVMSAACGNCSIPVTRVKEREAQVSTALRPPGPPWRIDHKLAAAAALAALATYGNSR